MARVPLLDIFSFLDGMSIPTAGSYTGASISLASMLSGYPSLYEDSAFL
jgi:hypothetical protein